MKKIFLYAAGFALAVSSFADECHPSINSNEQNFVVGYGSLMNDSSRMRTNPKAENVYPVEVKNFERVWGLRAGGSYRTTALLVVPKQGAHLNAVYYPVNSDGMKSADSREVHYCRYKIPTTDIQSLGLKNLQKGTYWIYAQQPNAIKKPNKEYPIIQSYVDLFITGCMQIQDRYLIKGFVKECIQTTKGWNNNAWINDRVNPRRPTDSTPGAIEVDNYLVKYLGKAYYNHKYE
ncbi:gamma-glutamylcyclotransferase family protein [Francisella sp. LA112445]|uniref:gamma-glutamylcyclotransferase family protein n=1 Tax=Francisella sp. LA112445 TaxID=1395624 RepID=UPI001788DAE4|nr:gamma-glutamylcyclotransferase family protein [Francisella sp. LA112445]QIW10744.1 gamma-glutamylcyclotransferase [Francisella sp. LA112445]